MKELSSYQIQFQHSIKTNQIMSIHKFVCKNNFNVYLHQNHLIADASQLHKLLSFFLLLDIDEPVLMIIDGEGVSEAYEKIERLCGDSIVDSSCRRNYKEAMVNSNISISV